MQKPKKWYDVYPYGTKEGDEEAKVFRALSRHKKFDYRSTGMIIKETGLSRERIEEIIDKYISCEPPLVYPHPSNEEHWGYWERVPDQVQDKSKTISGNDKESRIDKHLSGNDMVVNGSNASGADACADLICNDPTCQCGDGTAQVLKDLGKIKSLADLVPNCFEGLTGEVDLAHKEEGWEIYDHTPPEDAVAQEEWVLDV